MIRLANSPTIQIRSMGEASRNPHTGAPDGRWRNGIPGSNRLTLEIDFDDTDEDGEKILGLLLQFGIKI